MELRHLAALQAIAQARSFRRAADDLGYVQSAVSQQIAFLERALGVRLLERSRGPGPVGLTDAGALMVEHADVIMSELGAAQEEMAAMALGRSGLLRIGVLHEIAPAKVAALLRAFARVWPDVETQLTESRSDDELAGAVQHGVLDVSFAYLPLPVSSLECHQLVKDPYVLAVPATSTVARGGILRSVDELQRIELTQPRGRHAALVEEQLWAHGVRPVIVRRADSMTAAQALVGAGIGSLFIPASCLDESDAAVRTIEVGSLLRPRTLAIVWRKGRSPTPAQGDLVRIAERVMNGQPVT